MTIIRTVKVQRKWIKASENATPMKRTVITFQHYLQITQAHKVGHVLTSNTPMQFVMVPRAPASSSSSRRAATAASSVGSMPPPGTTHLEGSPLPVTSNTCSGAQKTTHSTIAWHLDVAHSTRSLTGDQILPRAIQSAMFSYNDMKFEEHHPICNTI